MSGKLIFEGIILFAIMLFAISMSGCASSETGAQIANTTANAPANATDANGAVAAEPRISVIGGEARAGGISVAVISAEKSDYYIRDGSRVAHADAGKAFLFARARIANNGLGRTTAGTTLFSIMDSTGLRYHAIPTTGVPGETALPATADLIPAEYAEGIILFEIPASMGEPLIIYELYEDNGRSAFLYWNASGLPMARYSEDAAVAFNATGNSQGWSNFFNGYGWIDSVNFTLKNTGKIPLNVRVNVSLSAKSGLNATDSQRRAIDQQVDSTAPKNVQFALYPSTKFPLWEKTIGTNQSWEGMIYPTISNIGQRGDYVLRVDVVDAYDGHAVASTNVTIMINEQETSFRP